MPALHLKEVRLPELHLPEMSRDDIVRVIGEASRDADLGRLDPRRLDLPEFGLPELDLAKVEMPKIELTKVDLPKLELTKVDLSRIDVAKALGMVAQAAGIVRRRRSRLPLVIGGLVVVGVIGAAVATSPMVRPRLQSLGGRVRERVGTWRAARTEPASSEASEPRAFDAAVAMPIEPSAYTDAAPTTGSPFDGPGVLPEGLGAAVTSEP